MTKQIVRATSHCLCLWVCVLMAQVWFTGSLTAVLSLFVLCAFLVEMAASYNLVAAGVVRKILYAVVLLAILGIGVHMVNAAMQLPQPPNEVKVVKQN